MQIHHFEYLLDSVDFVARYDVICLAERSHDGKNGVEKLRLDDPQTTNDGAPQGKPRVIAADTANECAGQTAHAYADHGANKCN